MPSEFIQEEIRKKGDLTFARFMELALYCPESGYYETDRAKVGRGGDFITSVSVGPLFGELLAFQFAAWLEALAGSSPPVLVEAGAHDGRLAGDLLAWLQSHRPELFRAMEYWIIEPSPNRRRWQEARLAGFRDQLRWAPDFAALTGSRGSRGLTGIIFGNELLDAFPVHRYGWDRQRGRWFEWGVGSEAGKLVWRRLAGAAIKPPEPGLAAVLPEGYTVEHCPAAEAWWREAAGGLAQGRLMTIDYGLAAGEAFAPGRVQGTVRAYARHRPGGDLLADPGSQDLTAHVDFAAIQTAGEAMGLTTEHFETQARFLTGILARLEVAGLAGGWDAPRRRQFQTLTHPEHFGRAFRVLVQMRRP